MKIDKEYAFQILKILEESFPNSLSGSEIDKKINSSDEEKEKIQAYLSYLREEQLVSYEIRKYTLTSKAINLLTDGMTMEEWIHKHKKKERSKTMNENISKTHLPFR